MKGIDNLEWKDLCFHIWQIDEDREGNGGGVNCGRHLQNQKQEIDETWNTYMHPPTDPHPHPHPQSWRVANNNVM